MRKFLVRFLSVSAVLFAGLMTAAPAQAGDYDGVCNTNEVCVYRDANGWSTDGTRSDFFTYYANYNSGNPLYPHTYNYPASCNNVAYAWCNLNDSASGLDNWDQRWGVRFFTDAFYDGSKQTIGKFGRANATYNDAYSSHCWNDGTIKSSTDPDCQFAA